ncbi:PGPGW domain-containing protein [Sabulicella glaciei]|uniref:Transmembrane protein (PGPGW) n=1 Tax=Sabulicella glaciei TaxID=2984948 RepID=A0ABT3NVH8_9PROT|nr:PGPGW domain-containing protein [Roseococcus sp. MDT2-1-1]MCW8086171.1 hypothetical protein [Roseococcus sp. MDT2-1-1]
MIELRPCRRRKAVGFASMAMGPVGLVLPVLPGFLFVALGVFVLRDQYVWAHRGVRVIQARWPALIPAVEAREQKALDWTDRQVTRMRGIVRRR